jgi:hypothetical protein
VGGRVLDEGMLWKEISWRGDLVLVLELELKEKDLTRININKRRGNITPRSGGNEKKLNLLKQRA